GPARGGVGDARPADRALAFGVRVALRHRVGIGGRGPQRTRTRLARARLRAARRHAGVDQGAPAHGRPQGRAAVPRVAGEDEAGPLSGASTAALANVSDAHVLCQSAWSRAGQRSMCTVLTSHSSPASTGTRTWPDESVRPCQATFTESRAKTGCGTPEVSAERHALTSAPAIGRPSSST